MPIARWEHCGSRSNALAQGQTAGTLPRSRTFLSMPQTVPEQPHCSGTARHTPGCRASGEGIWSEDLDSPASGWRWGDAGRVIRFGYVALSHPRTLPGWEASVAVG